MKRALAILLPILALLAVYVGVEWTSSEVEQPSIVPTRDGAETGLGGTHDLSDSGAPPMPPGSGTLVLALEGEGLRLFDPAAGSARPVPFGTPAATTLSMLAAALEGEAREDGESFECRALFTQLGNGLTLWFVDDDFVGWSVHAPAPSLTTASGIGIGSSRADLEDVYAARIAESSLGTEFSAGGLAGLLESPSAEARITNLWAGQTCIAR